MDGISREGNILVSNKVPTGYYAFIYQGLVPLAREFGYALCLHGSMSRDLDLVAIPWVDDAKDPYSLVTAIRDSVCGHINNEWDFEKCVIDNDFSKRNPAIKPHGRLSWDIQLGGGLYIDLSVIPKLK
jgi:hypothetical protein